MSKIPTFTTNRLILKEVTLDYVPGYYKHFVDYEVIQYLSHMVPWPFPENGIEDFLTKSVIPFQGTNKWVWGIFLKDNPEDLIGVVDLWREGRPENRGFWLGKQFWNKGIMTEAVEPVMNYAFDSLGFETLVFANAVGNIGSRKVKEKTGCKLLRIEPAKFVDPRFTEHEVWKLSKTDWNRYLQLKN